MIRLCFHLLLFSMAMVAAPASLSAQDRPNIVLIVSDDHAWTDYSFMGHPHLATPNIDRLAREGLTFARGYVPSSLCCPSLASIVTGLYPHEHGITGNDPAIPSGMTKKAFRRSPLFQEGREAMNRRLETTPTLPRLLSAAGYLSLQTGKWWQGHYERGGFTHGMTQGERHGDEGLEIGRKTMEPIYEFIADARTEQKPFFVWYAPMMPHTPHTPPARLLEKYRPLAPTDHVARYWAMVEWFDETVGDLLDHLDEQGVADDTIVVYLADNGWITDPDSGGYAAKSKQSPYDGGLRSPIIIRWPGRAAPERSQQLASSLDLAPTLLTAAGLKPTAAMGGIDLLNRDAVTDRQSVCGECFTHDVIDLDNPAASLRWRWIVEGDWKLIVPAGQNGAFGEAELYDLSADPHEERNLAPEKPDESARLRRELDGWWSGEAAVAGR
jgi:arylsulfatase A-like enzyme